MSTHVSVIDANVLVSAIFGGIPLACVKRAYHYQVCYTTAIETELLSLPKKLAGKLSSEQGLRLLHHLRVSLARGVHVRPRRRINCCRDPKDNAYLEASLAAKANFLITGDRDLLEITPKALEDVGLGSLLIVTPKQFLQIIREE